MAVLYQARWHIIATFIASFFLTYLLVKAVPRKEGKPANVGGLAIFLSFWGGFFALYPVLLFNSPQWRMCLASLVIVITGLLDDYLELKPWQKSIGILLAANIIYFWTGLEFSSVLIPNLSPLLFDVLSYLLTIFWIYFVTNALNLLDGIDGLVSSVSITSLMTLIIMTFISSLSIRLTFIMMLILLTATILGFLPFNWYPAKIYLGDTGALFIGFMFASLSVFNLKNVSFFSLILPIMFYAVPLFDTSYSIIRRLLKGQSIVQKDEDHIHHRLLRFGLSVPQVVLIMIGVTIVFSFLAILTQVYRQIRDVILIMAALLWLAMAIAMARINRKK